MVELNASSYTLANLKAPIGLQSDVTELWTEHN